VAVSSCLFEIVCRYDVLSDYGDSDLKQPNVK